MAAAKIDVIGHIDWQIQQIDQWLTHEGSESTRALLEGNRRALTKAKARIEHQDALRIATPTVRDAYRQAALQGLLARSEVFDTEDLVVVVDEIVDAMMGSR